MIKIEQSKKEIYKILPEHIEDLFPTGSRYICDPPVMSTDEDWMLYIKQKNSGNVIRRLNAKGFRQNNGGSEIASPIGGEAYSFKKYNSDLNIIVTTSKAYFNGFKTATRLAKKMNVTNKRDRIKLFQLTLGETITV